MNGQTNPGAPRGERPARELAVPQQFARMNHLAGELQQFLGELDARLKPVLQDEPPEPCGPPQKVEPANTVAGQLSRHNENIEAASARVRKMLALLEI